MPSRPEMFRRALRRAERERERERRDLERPDLVARRMKERERKARAKRGVSTSRIHHRGRTPEVKDTEEGLEKLFKRDEKMRRSGREREVFACNELLRLLKEHHGHDLAVLTDVVQPVAATTTRFAVGGFCWFEGCQ